MSVRIADLTGDFAEDKDIAAEIRESHVKKAVEGGHDVTLDFTGVTLVTQSFVHTLISDVLRSSGEAALKHLVFKGCTNGVRGIVETVVQYSLETMEEGD